jgi:hypothetical protein
MIPNSYRIMKLRSGEQIITEIKSSGKKFRVKRPMAMRSGVAMDPLGGQKEFIILRDWLQHTQEIETSIPEDFIVTILRPSKEMSEMYDEEKEKADVNPIMSSNMDIFNSTSFEELKKTIQDELDNLDDMDERYSNTLKGKDEFIMMSLSLNFETLKKLFDVGVITEEDFSEIARGFGETNHEEISGETKYTKGDGTEWTDWSPFPKDYLDNDGSENNE